ncbi:hypothetical protein [Streptomyces sp. ICBB 8177]|uniref:hypothetical protein n=1 Tax=Streptomyces sp. ICBB 8177 TaxID=563922 RepID=UPI000D67ED25|nr:hypothetical protein [Streptomyces sp. ICBB 8177]PWI44692.1 hypothetical protein CK485_08185 [Streptomyces sp. ICBB 8177]
MTLTLSAVLLFGGAAAVALKFRSAKFGGALVIYLFGFFTASTSAAGPIRTLCASLAHSLSTIGH